MIRIYNKLISCAMKVCRPTNLITSTTHTGPKSPRCARCLRWNCSRCRSSCSSSSVWSTQSTGSTTNTALSSRMTHKRRTCPTSTATHSCSRPDSGRPSSGARGSIRERNWCTRGRPIGYRDTPFTMSWVMPDYFHTPTTTRHADSSTRDEFGMMQVFRLLIIIFCILFLH